MEIEYVWHVRGRYISLFFFRARQMCKQIQSDIFTKRRATQFEPTECESQCNKIQRRVM